VKKDYQTKAAPAATDELTMPDTVTRGHGASWLTW